MFEKDIPGTALSQNKTREDAIKHTAELLLKHDNFLLITHARPDADTIGSAVALGEALRISGKQVKIMCTDKIPPRLSFLLDCIGEPETDGSYGGECCPFLLKPDEFATFQANFIVTVDVASVHLIGEYPEKMIPRIDMKIDHHPPRDCFAEYDCTFSDAAACGEIIYGIVKAMQCPLTKNIATSLYSAIISDTGSFRFSNATPDTHRIVAALSETGFDHAEVCRILFSTHTLSEMRATELAIHNLRFFRDGTVAATTISSAEIAAYGITKDDTSSINSIPIGVNGVELGITIKEDVAPNKYKLSLRSNKYMDTSELAAAFGGGGHLHASGGIIEADSIETALELILNVVYSLYGNTEK